MSSVEMLGAMGVGKTTLRNALPDIKISDQGRAHQIMSGALKYSRPIDSIMPAVRELPNPKAIIHVVADVETIVARNAARSKETGNYDYGPHAEKAAELSRQIVEHFKSNGVPVIEVDSRGSPSVNAARVRKWLKPHDTFSGEPLAQRQDELDSFIQLLQRKKVTSFLEIGSRHGDTFHKIGMALPEKSVLTAVDMPDGPWGRSNSRGNLDAAVADLNANGRVAKAIYGDSAAISTRQMVSSSGPYDAVLIDGDHRFEGLALDWIHYGKAKIVALHDIDGEAHFEARNPDNRVEVPFIWQILKRRYRYQEIVGSKRGMGIGVIFP